MLMAVLLSGCSMPGEEAHLQATIAASEGRAAQQVIDAAGPPSRTEAPGEECRAKNGTRELFYDAAAGWLNPSPEHVLRLCVDGDGTIVDTRVIDIHGPVPAWSNLVYLLVLFLTVWRGAPCPAIRAALLAIGLFVADLAVGIAVDVAGVPLPSSMWLSVALLLTVITTVRVAIVAAALHRLTRRLVASMAVSSALTLSLDLLV